MILTIVVQLIIRKNYTTPLGLSLLHCNQCEISKKQPTPLKCYK